MEIVTNNGPRKQTSELNSDIGLLSYWMSTLIISLLGDIGHHDLWHMVAYGGIMRAGRGQGVLRAK